MPSELCLEVLLPANKKLLLTGDRRIFRFTGSFAHTKILLPVTRTIWNNTREISKFSAFFTSRAR